MKVCLAGYNVDTTVLSDIETKIGKREDLTPEVLSASYARISRDPRPIDEIRKSAREEVEKSRKSNSTIIFKMGHHSVAEHAVFNFDIIGVSRLAMEELEKFRLCSYTEKSQRYITLDNDFIIPEEIKNSVFEKLFVDTINKQNEAYFKLLEKLKVYVFDKNSELAENPKNHNLLEGWAKEDSRYVTSLSTEAQVGQTINARNLELLLRRFASHPLQEIKSLGRAIYEQVSEVAPSIILFHKANDRDQNTFPEMKKLTEKILASASAYLPDEKSQDVQLVKYTKDGDNIIAASILHVSSNLPYEQCSSIVENLSEQDRKNIFKTVCQNMQFYDSMPREFEYVNFTFNIALSSACFGQLKRHRMSTITAQPYYPGLGIIIPESIKQIGMEAYFKDIINKTNDAYNTIYKEMPLAAPYILTNAHRKRVLIRVNARELYHISRLREDLHAQWDIRNISASMSQQAKKVMPLTFSLIGAKDKFNEIYKKVYGKLPKITEAALPGTKKIK